MTTLMKSLLSLRSSIILLIAGAYFLVAQAAPININEASIPQIIHNLTDIGPVKATAIVEYRELNGPFKHPEDLLGVKGFGQKTLEKNRENLLFNNISDPIAAENNP